MRMTPHPNTIKVYHDAHGRTTRPVKHHMFLPHEIIGSLYDSNHFDLVYPGAEAAPYLKKPILFGKTTIMERGARILGPTRHELDECTPGAPAGSIARRQ